MDQLEEFIRNNRDRMDLHDPDPEIWYKVRRRFTFRKVRVMRWSVAAAVIIIAAGTALILYLRSESTMTENLTAGSTRQELKETEMFYNSIVNSLYREAEPLLTGQPEIREELYSDMARIDSICLDIRKDLKDNIANREVIEALVQNYRIKIEILEDMLNTLKENDDLNENGKHNEM